MIFSYGRTGPLAFEYDIARGSGLNEPLTSSNDIPQITIRPASPKPGGCYATAGRSQQIEVAGRQVTVTRLPTGAEPPEQDLCAVSAVGLAVDIVTSGNQPPIDVTTLFAHLRLLGPSPRKWATTPSASRSDCR